MEILPLGMLTKKCLKKPLSKLRRYVELEMGLRQALWLTRNLMLATLTTPFTRLNQLNVRALPNSKIKGQSEKFIGTNMK